MPLILARSGELYNLMPGLLLPHSGVFVSMAAFVLLMLPTMLFLPDKPDQRDTRRRDADLGTTRAMTTAASLTVMGCFAIAVFSPYTFIQLRAQAVGMTPHAIGNMISTGVAVGISGAVVAGWTGRRSGITLPLLGGLIFQGICCLVVSIGQTETALFIATIGYMMAWSFAYPYLFGLGAAIDPDGGLPTAIGGVYLVGSSVAAGVGGMLMQFRGYEAVGWSSFALCGLAALVAFPLGRSIDATRRRGSAP
jgi:predicted MFS family arabinose efflux permease